MVDIKLLLAKPMLKWMLIPLLVAAGAAFYKWAPWIQQDNPVEEKIEQLFEWQTGHDVDLSPDSEEGSGNSK